MSWHSVISQHLFVFERAVVTPYTFAAIYIPAILSYYIMAILVQLPHTGSCRAAFLPVAFWLMLRASMSLDFSWDPFFAFFNQGLVISMATYAIRSTKWAFAQQPYTRLPICRSGVVATNVHNGDTSAMLEHEVPLSQVMWNACDLVTNFRGLGWNGPQKIHTSTPYFQVESRLIFAMISLFQSTFSMLVSYLLCRTIQSFGPDTFGTLEGGTIVDSSLPPVERYTKSSTVTLLSGIASYCIIDGLYWLGAALCTIFLQHYPSQWPPLFDSPWSSTSLASFWGRRWHQGLRECFVEAGSRPMEKLFGQVGTIMGAFAVSGVLHDIGLRAMGRGASGDTLRITGFFLLHGVGVTTEYAWKQVTGRRVGGFIGWLWVFTWLISSGHLIVDVWARRGLIAAMSYPLSSLPRYF